MAKKVLKAAEQEPAPKPRVEPGQNWLNFELYKIKTEYPKKPVRPIQPNGNDAKMYRAFADALDVYNTEMEKYNELVDKYNDEDCRLFNDFRDDSLDAVGLGDHEAKERAFEYAWDQGHAYGYNEVWLKLQGIAHVILGN